MYMPDGPYEEILNILLFKIICKENYYYFLFFLAGLKELFRVGAFEQSEIKCLLDGMMCMSVFKVTLNKFHFFAF